MIEAVDEKTKQVLGSYLVSRKILIVDPNGPARAGMARMLVGLGAKSNNLTLVADYEVAREVIHTSKHDIIITEYNIAKGTGLALAGEYNRIRDVADSLFVILTANSSQSIVAQAAEEDVDVYILKPYTMNYFLDTMTKAVLAKANPSPYVQNINLGKLQLAEKQLDAAIALFEQAIPQNPVPSLAYYYKSQAEILKQMLDEAENSLQSGLKYNEVHYKCLTGLFDLYLERGKLNDAYGMVKRLTTFPLNPKRLSKVIELAVKTAHYEDIDKYYEAFKAIDYRDDEVIKHICAALVVSGKMLFQRGDIYRAASFLKKASVSAAGRSAILLEIVTTLAINDFLSDAQAALNRFTPDSQSDYQYQVASFMIAYYEGANSWKYVTWLRLLIDQGTNDPMHYYWTIAMLQASNKTDLAEDYLSRARIKWPEKNDFFQKALKAIPKKKPVQ